MKKTTKSAVEVPDLENWREVCSLRWNRRADKRAYLLRLTGEVLGPTFIILPWRTPFGRFLGWTLVVLNSHDPSTWSAFISPSGELKRLGPGPDLARKPRELVEVARAFVREHLAALQASRSSGRARRAS